MADTFAVRREYRPTWLSATEVGGEDAPSSLEGPTWPTQSPIRRHRSLEHRLQLKGVEESWLLSGVRWTRHEVALPDQEVASLFLLG